LIAKSDSPNIFASKLEKIPPDSIMEIAFWSNALSRKICIWDIGNLTESDFKKINTWAKELLPEIRKDQERLNNPVDDSQSHTIEEFGLVLRPAGADVLAEKLVLSGLLVEDVSTQGKKIGFRQGDIILDYDHVYSMVMGWHNLSYRTRNLDNRLKREQEMKVLRWSHIVTINEKNKK
jgi:hypothetical protein